MPRDGERVLFLDDSPERTAKFKELYPNGMAVETAQECIEKLQTLRYTTLMLDHDLNGEVYVDSRREDCGMEVVRYLERMIVRGTFVSRLRIFIHSHNVPGSNNMLLALQRAGYTVHRQPFGFGELWNGV